MSADMIEMQRTGPLRADLKKTKNKRADFRWIKRKAAREAAQRWEEGGPSTRWGDPVSERWPVLKNTDWERRQQWHWAMVKISFQSVAGQKVEKENDGDKTEILIPHPMVSKHLAYCLSVFTIMLVIVFLTWHLCNVMPAVSAGQSAPAQSWTPGDVWQHVAIWLETKTCHCCGYFLCASALIAGLMQVITKCMHFLYDCIEDHKQKSV